MGPLGARRAEALRRSARGVERAEARRRSRATRDDGADLRFSSWGWARGRLRSRWGRSLLASESRAMPRLVVDSKLTLKLMLVVVACIGAYVNLYRVAIESVAQRAGRDLT